MTYAKLISETKIDTNAPRSAVIDGSTVCGQLPEDYLNSIGWYRLEETPAPEPREGYHFEPRYAYDSAEAPTRVVRSWAEVQNPPPPPRSLSKVKLMRALKARSLWLPVKAFIEASEDYADEWALSTTLDEDNALIVSAIAALKQSLGLTDEQVETILSASVAE
jgi:hypothetical protein